MVAAMVVGVAPTSWAETGEPETPAPAAEADHSEDLTPETLSGRVVVLVPENAPDDDGLVREQSVSDQAPADPEVYVVNVDGWHEVGAEVLDEAQPGDGVEVTLDPVGEVTDVTVVEPAVDSGAATARGAGGAAIPTGTRTVWLVVMSPPGVPVTSADVTRAQAGIADMDAFWSTQSGGKVRFSTARTVNGAGRLSTCERSGNGGQAVWGDAVRLPEIAAIPSGSWNPALTHLVVVTLGCSYQGGNTGYGSISQGAIPGDGRVFELAHTVVWDDTTMTYSPWPHVDTIAHEIGHNLGRWHANVLECPAAPLDEPITGLTSAKPRCSVWEYGDTSDIMSYSGRPAMGALSAPAAADLGFDLRTVTVPTTTAVQHVSLSPLSLGAGTRAVRVQAGGVDYWIEYRTDEGLDAGLEGWYWTSPLTNIRNNVVGGIRVLKDVDGDQARCGGSTPCGTLLIQNEYSPYDPSISPGDRSSSFHSGQTVTLANGALQIDVCSTVNPASVAVRRGNAITCGQAAVTGTPSVGSTLTADTSVARRWTNTDRSASTELSFLHGPTLSYQWLRNGTAISGATKATYTTVAADRDQKVSVRVTGARPGYASQAVTSAAVTVTQAAFTGGSVTITPSSGALSPGVVLTATPAGFTPTPSRYTYQWYRGMSATTNRTAITGATGSTYTVGTADLGSQIIVEVTATSANYTPKTVVSSARQVAYGTFSGGTATISGQPKTGQELKAVPAGFTPNPTSYSYTWYRNGTLIPGAYQQTYRPGAADIGQTITVRVSASLSGYTTKSVTSSAVTVAQGAFTGGVASVVGTPAAGQVLTATAVGISPTPSSYTYQWYFGSTPISGATQATFTPQVTDVGKQLSVVLTARADGVPNRTLPRSAAVTITSGFFTGYVEITPNTAPGAVVRPGAVFTAESSVTPATTPAYRWLRDGKVISGATGQTYTATAGDVGKKVTVEATVSRTGYTDKTFTSDPITVQPGVLAGGGVAIAGTAKVGATVTAKVTAPNPAPSATTYQWLRDGAAITGATGATYTPVAADAGRRLTVRATMSLAGYGTKAITSAAVTVASGTFTGGAVTAAGSRTAGATLTAKVTAPSPASTATTYQWVRDGVAIPGATRATYVVTAADVGTKVTVRAVVNRAGYTAKTLTSSAVSIAPATFAGGAVTVSGARRIGATLTAKVSSAFTPSPSSISYQWLRDGVAIKGATAATYKVTSADFNSTLTARATAVRTGYTHRAVTSSGMKIDSVTVTYRPHVQSIGWMPTVKDGAVGGTSGRSLRVEALRLGLVGAPPGSGVSCAAHVQNIGWMAPVPLGRDCGTSGRSLRVEALRLTLSGPIAKTHDIWYRAHVQNIGWMGWAKNGASIGSAGYSYRAEAYQIVIRPKGSPAPGSTARAFVAR